MGRFTTTSSNILLMLECRRRRFQAWCTVLYTCRQYMYAHWLLAKKSRLVPPRAPCRSLPQYIAILLQYLYLRLSAEHRRFSLLPSHSISPSHSFNHPSMKIILTGATGLIGSAVLQRLISLPTITSIIVLSRRELPTKHPKIQTIIIHDFLHGYSPDVLASIQGAEACIWVLGSPTSGREVHHDMTMAATKAFSENCVEQVGKDSGGGGGQKAFRFVYTSGSLVVRDQNAQTGVVYG